MTFIFPPGKYNEELLLSTFSDEQLFDAIGVPITTDKFCSPFRDDNFPTCNLWKSPNTQKLYYRDWAVMSKPMDVVTLVQSLRGGKRDDAVAYLWSVMDEKKNKLSHQSFAKIKVAKPADIFVHKRDMDETDLSWWSSFGVLKEQLDKFNVYALAHARINRNSVYLHGPSVSRAYYYDFGDGKYKVYFPHRSSYRFMHNCANVLQGYSQLPDEGELLVITKSMKDVMVLDRMDIPSVAPGSETVTVSYETLEELRSRFNHIVVLFDNDLAGIRSLKWWKKNGLPCFWLPRHGAKDVSDLVKERGYDYAQQFIDFHKVNFLESNGY